MAEYAKQAYKQAVRFVPPGLRNIGRRTAEKTGLNKYIPESDPLRKIRQVFDYLFDDRTSTAVAFLQREQGKFNVDQYYIFGFSLLTYAVTKNQEAVVQALLQSGANPRLEDRHGIPPLLIAIQRNHANQIKERGLQHVNWGDTINIADQNDGIIRLLLDAGASPNDTIDTTIGPVPVIRWAIRQRNIPLVRLFVQRGGQLNNLLPNGDSLLDYAEADVTRYGHPEILGVLRELGARTAVQIREGPQYIREEEPRILPRGATNIVSYEDIEDGMQMANFDNESQFGRYYTEQSFRTLPRMENPFTRRPINPESVRLYTARIPPEEENGAPGGISEETYQKWAKWLGPEPRRAPTLYGRDQFREFEEAKRMHRERNPNLYNSNTRRKRVVWSNAANNGRLAPTQVFGTNTRNKNRNVNLSQALTESRKGFQGGKKKTRKERKSKKSGR